MYLADSLTSLEHADLADLEKPASIKLTTKGKRGNTDFTSSLMAIRVEGLFDYLPQYFRTKEDAKKDAEDKEDKPKERTVDWWIGPWTVEWRYKVIAPLGFKLRALPSDKSEKLETLKFTQKYSVNAAGTVVEAVLRVENPTQRLTVQQAKAMRDAVLKARASDAIFITFDHVGHALITAGKIKEGLAAYRQDAAQHPTEALHKVQLSQALLTAGLGEQARSVATEATVLEPKSAQAFRNLGSVLEDDLIGRPAKKGMDYNGAVAAYRKSLELDPKDKETRVNLAVLLEYDAEGTRYTDGAKLKEAVAEFRELKNVDEEYAHSYDDNVLYDLWYAHDYRGVLELAATLPTSDARKGLTLASVALAEGADAALKKSLQITTSDQERSTALSNAGTLLIRVRKYSEAAAVFAEAANNKDGESEILQRAEIFRKTKPYDEIKLDPKDPRSVVQQLFGEMLSGKLTFDEFKLMTYGKLESSDDAPEKQFQQLMSFMKAEFNSTGLPLVTMADMAVSNMQFTVDGDDSLGYKVIVETPGSPAQNMYVIRDGDHYRALAFSLSNSPSAEHLAPVVFENIEKNNLVAARKWLDRARDEIHMTGNDDPMADQQFPHFWTKGKKVDVSAMRKAALVLLPSADLKGEYLAELIEAQKATKDEQERDRLTMVLAYVYASQERWAELLPLTLELTNSYPNSERVLRLAVEAYTRLKRFDEGEKLIRAQMQEHPDEVSYARMLGSLLIFRGDYKQARAIFKTVIDKGRGTESDMNSYAWEALMSPGPIAQETIEAAQRANDLTKNSNFAIMHTLACIYAQAGKPSQARNLLLKAMDATHAEEPNSEVWFGFGLIAEQYGVWDAAEKMYARVEKPKFYYPGSSYELAQQHLSALHELAKSTAVKSAGH